MVTCRKDSSVTAGMEWTRLVAIGGALQAWIGAVASAMARHHTAGMARRRQVWLASAGTESMALRGSRSMAGTARHGVAVPGLAMRCRHGVTTLGSDGMAQWRAVSLAWQVNPRIRKDAHGLALLVWSGCERQAR